MGASRFCSNTPLIIHKRLDNQSALGIENIIVFVEVRGSLVGPSDFKSDVGR